MVSAILGWFLGKKTYKKSGLKEKNERLDKEIDKWLKNKK